MVSALFILRVYPYKIEIVGRVIPTPHLTIKLNGGAIKGLAEAFHIVK